MIMNDPVAPCLAVGQRGLVVGFNLGQTADVAHWSLPAEGADGLKVEPEAFQLARVLKLFLRRQRPDFDPVQMFVVHLERLGLGFGLGKGLRGLTLNVLPPSGKFP